MKTPLLTILGICALAGSSPAALTLVSREPFQGVGTLNSGTPGSLGAVTGSFYKRAVGPRLSTDATAAGRGWSADLQNQVDAYCQPAAAGAGVLTDAGYNSATNFFALDFWVYLAAPVGLGNNGKGLVAVGYSNGYRALDLRISSADGLTLNASSTAGAATGTGYTITPGQWVEIRAAVQQLSGNYTFSGSVLVRAPGATSFTEVLTTPSFTITVPPNVLQVGAINLGATPAFDGRIGMVSTYRLGSWADRTLAVSDVIDPPAGPFAWYCNPATGNDANDGTTPANAWASVAKINTESANVGMFLSTAGPGTGDTLTIDGSATSLDIGSNALQIQTRGLTVNLKGAEPIKVWKDVSAASATWTLASGSTKTYTTTDGAATDLTGVVVWEADKWLNHPTGSNFAAVQTTMDATPGSFFSDGTNLYLHPFGDTNPASDGKTYTRSRYRTANGSAGGSAILVQASDMVIQGDATTGQVVSYTDRLNNPQSFRASKIWKTCLARSTDSDPYNGYGVQWDTGAGGNCKTSNLFVDYYSKHAMGRTTPASNMFVTRQQCFYGQGSTYVGFGGQTQDVDYVDTGTGNLWAYVQCASVVNTGVVGSTAGAVTSAYQSWISHGGAANSFSGGSWADCSLCSVITSGSTIGPIAITRTLFGGGYTTCSTTMDQSRTTLEPFAIQYASGQTLTITNSIIGIKDTTAGNFWNYSQVTGNLLVLGCAVDLRGNATASYRSVWSKLTSASVTLQDVLFLTDANKDFTLLGDFGPSDTIIADHNAYTTGPSGFIVQRWNGGAAGTGLTFAQWQAAGKDTGGSFTTATPNIDANYYPLLGSPLLGVGTDLGPLADLTGRVRVSRKTIGALEPAITRTLGNQAAIRTALGL